MKTLLVRCALLFGVCVAGCRPTGSCVFNYTAADGYSFCKDYLGTEYNFTAAQSDCNNDDVIYPDRGVYSSSSCATAGTLGTCLIGTGTAQEYSCTYIADSDSDAGAATFATVESACGVAGGTFTAE